MASHPSLAGRQQAQSQSLLGRYSHGLHGDITRDMSRQSARVQRILDVICVICMIVSILQVLSLNDTVTNTYLDRFALLRKERTVMESSVSLAGFVLIFLMSLYVRCAMVGSMQSMHDKAAQRVNRVMEDIVSGYITEAEVNDILRRIKSA